MSALLGFSFAALAVWWFQRSIERRRRAAQAAAADALALEVDAVAQSLLHGERQYINEKFGIRFGINRVSCGLRNVQLVAACSFLAMSSKKADTRESNLKIAREVMVETCREYGDVFTPLTLDLMRRVVAAAASQKAAKEILAAAQKSAASAQRAKRLETVHRYSKAASEAIREGLSHPDLLPPEIAVIRKALDSFGEVNQLVEQVDQAQTPMVPDVAPPAVSSPGGSLLHKLNPARARLHIHPSGRPPGQPPPQG